VSLPLERVKDCEAKVGERVDVVMVGLH